MQLRALATVCAVRAHGEHGVVARLLTREAGLLAGYVRGGRSRRLRPVLQPGNRVVADYRARSDDQLPALIVELAHSRAGLHEEPLAADGIAWVTALVAGVLAEGLAHPVVADALDALLDAVEAAPSARGWAGGLARFELLLLAELGFGLDLARCAVTEGVDDLAFVSPKSGRAVSRAAGEPYADRLLPLPRFLIEGGEAGWREVAQALAITGLFLERDLLGGREARLLAARQRLTDRIARLARA
ncbi:DNA repair protein RecO [Sphingomonas sp.]|uniref:DNA repair protein RecO n=1 Tax=Sphingomonas sp. TaxID=28214 RepID=UPI003AFF8824